MKRGIIPLLNNIAIRFNKKDFEYDVYSLVKAFYPQAQITMFYGVQEVLSRHMPLVTLQAHSMYISRLTTRTEILSRIHT